MDETRLAWPPSPQKEKPAEEQAGAQEKSERSNHTTTKPDRKWRRVLAALLARRSFNRFEAERELHDHALHSTVSNLEAKGLKVSRREETVRGYMGTPTRVMRYSLDDPASIARARELLGASDAP